MKTALVPILLCAWCFSQVPTPQRAADPHPYPIGIDLSHHSGEIDWARLKAEGISFVFLKATEGEDFADPKFSEYFEAAKKFGIRRGAYHFFESGDDPEAMAAFFIQTVSLEADDLVPVIDIEILRKPEDAKGLVERLKRFIQLLEIHYGVRPMIYTGPNFWNAHLDAEFGDYPLWIAEFGRPEPQIPKGWKSWQFWQAVENQRIDGVEKDVDINYFNGKEDGIADLTLARAMPIPAEKAHEKESK